MISVSAKKHAGNFSLLRKCSAFFILAPQASATIITSSGGKPGSRTGSPKTGLNPVFDDGRECRKDGN